MEQVERVEVAGSRLAVARRPAAGTRGHRWGILLLHGWPGSHADWTPVMRLLAADAQFNHMELLVPDLIGFGSSDKPAIDHDSAEPFRAYTPAAHVAALEALLDHYEIHAALVGGYDVGGNLTQALARIDKQRVRGLVLCDPVHPAARVAATTMQLESETWYQFLHQQRWAADLIAHDRVTLETYLRHFYTYWWGKGTVDEGHFQLLVDQYARPGAFEASIAWYRARGANRRAETAAAASVEVLQTPTEVIWGALDPITPIAFADLLDRSFANFALTRLPDTGHFVPLEAPRVVADAFGRLAARAGPSSSNC